MIQFITGFLIGTFTGMFMMCLMAVAKDEEDKNK